jgi:hypothetical protein
VKTGSPNRQLFYIRTELISSKFHRLTPYIGHARVTRKALDLVKCLP